MSFVKLRDYSKHPEGRLLYPGLVFQPSPTRYVTNIMHCISDQADCLACVCKRLCDWQIKISPSHRVWDVHCSTRIAVLVCVCQRLSVYNNTQHRELMG